MQHWKQQRRRQRQKRRLMGSWVGEEEYHQYLTLEKKYNEWQVVWIGDLIREATQYFLLTDFKNAFAVCEEALLLDEYESALYELMAWSDLRVSYTDDLAYYVGEALKYGPKDASILGLAGMLPAEGEIGPAVAYYEQALGVAKNDAERAVFFGNMAHLYLQAGDVVQAKEVCEKAMALGPDDPHTHYVAATIRMAEEDFQGALSFLERAVSLEQMDDVYLQSALYYDYANLLAYEIEDAFRKDLKGRTYNVSDAARKYASLALSLEPENYYYEEMVEELGSYEGPTSLSVEEPSLKRWSLPTRERRLARIWMRWMTSSRRMRGRSLLLTRRRPLMMARRPLMTTRHLMRF